MELFFFISKVLERVVAQQLHLFHRNDNGGFLQTGFIPNHSTDTALVIVNDSLLSCRISLPVDLSAMFKTLS